MKRTTIEPTDCSMVPQCYFYNSLYSRFSCGGSRGKAWCCFYWLHLGNGIVETDEQEKDRARKRRPQR